VVRFQGVKPAPKGRGCCWARFSRQTKTFLGIIALAFDNGFDIAIILTKGTKA
jgi:hypothetical protein